MNKIKKIILKSILLLTLGVFVLAPNLAFAEEEQSNICRNTYIERIIPTANSQLEAMKFFFVELTPDTDTTTVEFYLNNEKQDVNIITKSNQGGYLGIIKIDEKLNKPGLLLVEISATGNNVKKCSDNLFVGMHLKDSSKTTPAKIITPPVITPKVSETLTAEVIVKKTPEETPVAPVITKIKEEEKVAVDKVATTSPEKEEKTIETEEIATSVETSEEENQVTAVPTEKLDAEKNNNFLFFAIILLALIILIYLFSGRNKKKKEDGVLDI